MRCSTIRPQSILTLTLIFFILVSSCSRNSPKFSSEDRGGALAEVYTEEAEADEMVLAKEAALADGAPAEAQNKKKGGKKKKDKKTWKKSVIESNTSKLMIGDREEIPIQGMEVFAKVDGFKARVLIDFYFYNQDDSQYEGTFKLRLPDGASPYFLAFGESKVEVDQKLGRASEDDLYAWDSKHKPSESIDYDPQDIMLARQANWIDPKEARMVPKKQAAQAYAKTVRRRVDPALMEWGGAGVFQARIFPIAPKKVHRVVVGYDMLVERLDEDLVFDLAVPQGLPSSRVHLEVAKLKGSEVVFTGVPDTQKPLEDGDRVYQVINNPLEKQIQVRVKQAAEHALLGTDAAVGDVFAAQVYPKLPTIKSSEVEPKPALFLIDKSLSSNPEKFAIWLEMAKQVLEQNESSIRTFNAIFFDIETRLWNTRFVDNTAENRAQFMAHANTLSLEGATDVGAALSSANQLMEDIDSREKVDIFLLSDGAITWGQGDAFMLTESLRKQSRMGALFAYRTGLAGTDTGMLSHLTREMGGALFSVVGESEVKAAATAHTSRPYRLKKVHMEGVSDVVLAGRPQYIYPGQRLLVAGRGGLKAGAKLKLDVEIDSKTKTIEVPIKEVIQSPLAARTYGQIAVEQLEELLGSTRPIAEAYARHFRVTGKSTSLLMLESEEDYRSYNIVPQDDIGLIKAKTVTVAMLNAFDEMAVRLGDAKAALFGWLKELETMPGVEARLPEELMVHLQEIAAINYEVQSSQLSCDMTKKEDISGAYAGLLAKRSVTYDEAAAEAARRLREGQRGDALRAMSSMIEQSPGDAVLARDVGFSAMEWGLSDHAYFLFERVAQSRPYEPQTWRALALAAAQQKKVALATAYFEVALAGSWDSRFGEFKRILAQDYLRFIKDLSADAPSKKLTSYLLSRRPALRDIFGVDKADMVITITWNTDNTDVDLHVLEPTGEECYYSNNRTRIGGALTQDVTQGYGPEMYVLPSAPEGKYVVRAKYFSSDRNRKSARTKVHATIIRHWGSENETVEQRVVSLEDNKEMHDLIQMKVN